MNPFHDMLEGVFKTPRSEGSDKVMPLDRAIREHVKPGMAIHLAVTHVIPYAASFEIARQFRGGNPGFTLISLGAVNNAIVLTHGHLLKKIITSYCGDIFPSPAPNPVFQKAYATREVEIENWSVLTLPLRLMAGALGIGFIPTRSILGSGMEAENKDSFRRMEDPFEPGRELGLLRALNPDITVLHAAASDPNGNVIVAPPYADNLWGALGSRNGVIATVEKIVSTDTVRRHAHLVKIPSDRVVAVCPAPFGGHPGGLYTWGIEGVESYAEDYDFIVGFQKTTRNPKALDDWVREWVFDCPTQEQYLKKLGDVKLSFLKAKADPEAYRREFTHVRDKLSTSETANAMETMTVIAARKIARRFKALGCKTILAGQGNSNLSAWMANYWLKQEGLDVDLVAEVGFYGYAPRPGDPFIFNFANLPTCKIRADAITSLGAFVGGESARCIGALGAGQVDRFGNINSTKVPNVLYLVGSGGANDVMSSAMEVVLVAPMSPMRFVNRVPYITAPGARVRTLVSTLGVLERDAPDKEFILTGYFPRQGKSLEEQIRHIKSQCGWDLKTAPEPEALEPPSLEELALVRALDPNGNFTRPAQGEGG